MESLLLYLVMRSTRDEPRNYGARLYVGEGYDDHHDFGSTVWADDDDVWDQARGLVEMSFGHKAAQRCIYVLEEGGWQGQHPGDLGPLVSAAYRKPGTHPEEDEWESADVDSFVKVTNDYGTVWFVANFHGDFSDAYLIIPSDIADKSLRREAVAPDVEVTERSAPVAVSRTCCALCYIDT